MSTGRKLWILPAMMLTLLTACSVIPGIQPIVASRSTDLVVTGQMDDMMEFYESIRKLPAPELGQVYETVKQKFVRNKSDANRARLVLLLILPNTSFRDINSALHLLNEWPREAQPTTNLQNFRNLLAALLADQQRLHHSVEELSQKLKDEQKRVETLKSQIDAIKSMEKNLILREL
ncbi:dihydrolipoamide acyltransferase [Nitrosovibrio sp. Nv4]|uniref:dihydrolipoamide acyltransferase n=1 Tax=Nitrosovibrio sp. Nv4 TaxID=1945880 RepID=UPI000BCDFD25|nr:dihydrolipoamide acyltransferase [Nitrosovibrio sp. Nv4]SOD41387.1 hypothetical protein SAMN06298226_1682 [Nitrosovibrio sp. Nv4]